MGLAWALHGLTGECLFPQSVGLDQLPLPCLSMRCMQLQGQRQQGDVSPGLRQSEQLGEQQLNAANRCPVMSLQKITQHTRVTRVWYLRCRWSSEEIQQSYLKKSCLEEWPSVRTNIDMTSPTAATAPITKEYKPTPSCSHGAQACVWRRHLQTNLKRSHQRCWYRGPEMLSSPGPQFIQSQVPGSKMTYQAYRSIQWKRSQCHLYMSDGQCWPKNHSAVGSQLIP